MAYTPVDTEITKIAADSTPTYVLPSYSEGDLLLCIVNLDAENGGYGITGGAAGWTELIAYGDATYDYIAIYAKIAGASETNPTFTIGQTNASTGVISSWAGGPASLTGIVHTSATERDTSNTHPYSTPALTITQNGCLIIYAATLSFNNWQYSGSSLPNSSTGLCVADADANNDGTFTDFACVASYAIQTTAANISTSSFVNGNASAVRNDVIALALLPPATTKKLKFFAHSSASGVSSIKAAVYSAPSGGDITGTTKYGEVASKSFESSLESGKAVLKIALSEIGNPSLAVDATAVAVVKGTTLQTEFITGTVIEE